MALADSIRAACAEVARRTPGLALLVLHGSRAQGQARADSDWDFAFEASTVDLDVDALLAGLVDAVGADRLDLADLRRAGALLRFRVAETGILIFEAQPGTYQHFWFDAVHTWCDLAPVLLPVYERTLQALPR
jgi:hypothetical protein